MQPIDASSQYAEKLGQFFCSGQTHFIFHATLCTVSLKVPGSVQRAEEEEND